MSTPAKLDFARLTLKDALDLAILIEEEAQERYHEFAHQMDAHRTPDAARFFRFMAQNEQRHGAELAARRESRFGGEARSVSRGQLFDVEAPEYDEARAFMSARQAMQAALRSEEKAHAFFVDALPGIQDPAVRALFEQLRDEETAHQELVLKEIAKLPVGDEADPSDYVDEPVAQ